MSPPGFGRTFATLSLVSLAAVVAVGALAISSYRAAAVDASRDALEAIAQVAADSPEGVPLVERSGVHLARVPLPVADEASLDDTLRRALRDEVAWSIREGAPEAGGRTLVVAVRGQRALGRAERRLGGVDERAARLDGLLAALAVGAVAASFAGARWVARGFAREVAPIARTAEALAKG
ncbi:MAG TPA: hypothetical protein VKE69_12125, partial [Planctomycetota bacterium]|nr:hypothetical protein [Planctomycetota bacterium]